MRMSDLVNNKCCCPKCGTEISNFQSKAEGRDLDELQACEFYAACSQCGYKIEFSAHVKERTD